MKTERTKRVYSKKRLITQDELWKLIILHVWDDFIIFFLEDWVAEIDFSRKPEFLDKDMKRLIAKGKTMNRTVDMLMRVYLKSGETKAFLLHVEVQGYFDAEFPKRVFQYFYRISDSLSEPIETLVIMIDDDKKYFPDQYHESFGRTEVIYKYRLFKLLHNAPPYLGKESNPFSIVLETAWYALKENLLNDEALEQLKLNLIKQLLSKKQPREKIYRIFEFIKFYLPFENKEKGSNFESLILESLIFKEDNDMEAMTVCELVYSRLEKQATAKGIRQGRKEGREEGRVEIKETVIINLHKKAFSNEAIAEVLDESLDTVIKVIQKYKEIQIQP